MDVFRSKTALAALTDATLSRALRRAARDKVRHSVEVLAVAHQRVIVQAIRILSEKLWRLRFLVRAQVMVMVMVMVMVVLEAGTCGVCVW